MNGILHNIHKILIMSVLKAKLFYLNVKQNFLTLPGENIFYKNIVFLLGSIYIAINLFLYSKYAFLL